MHPPSEWLPRAVIESSSRYKPVMLSSASLSFRERRVQSEQCSRALVYSLQNLRQFDYSWRILTGFIYCFWTVSAVCTRHPYWRNYHWAHVKSMPRGGPPQPRQRYAKKISAAQVSRFCILDNNLKLHQEVQGKRLWRAKAGRQVYHIGLMRELIGYAPLCRLQFCK